MVWAVFTPLLDLRPHYGGGNEDYFLQKVPCSHCCMQCPQTCRPPPTHTSARDSRTLMGSLLLSPGSWCTQGFVCALQESLSQSCVSSGCSMVGLMTTSFKRAYAIPTKKPFKNRFNNKGTLERKLTFVKHLCVRHYEWYWNLRATQQRRHSSSITKKLAQEMEGK